MSVSLVDSIFGTSASAAPPVASTSAAALLFETKIEIPERVVEEQGPANTSSLGEDATLRNKRLLSHEQPTETTPKKQRKKPRQQTAKSVDTAKDDNTSNTTDGPTPAPDPTTADAEAAITNSNNDQPVDVVEARTVFVGNLPNHYNRKLLRQLFIDCGPIESTRIRSVATTGVKLPPAQAGNQALVQKVCANTGRVADESVKPCVSGYVVFQSVTSVPAALAKNATTVVEGRHLRVDRAVATHDPARTVFVGNLPYSADEESLAQHFMPILNAHYTADTDSKSTTTPLIENVRIVRDPTTQQCKGFAYVLLRDAAAAAVARQYGNETLYRKRPLRVQVCGKRCKNQRGGTTVPKATARRQQQHDAASPTARNALQRVLAKKGGGDSSSGGANNKRKRAPNTSGSNKTNNKHSKATGTGKSKRAAAQAKSSQRTKTMVKRLTQGMGKMRKKTSS